MSRAGIVVVALALAACSHGTGPGAASGGAGGAAGQAALPPPRDVPPAELLARQPDETEVLLRTSVARTHPLGPKLEPFVLAWPGWSKTLRRLSSHPLAELDWIDIVGPHDVNKERLASRTALDDAAMDTRLASSSDGTLRVAARKQPHLVTVASPDTALAVQQALETTHVVDPPGAADEGLRALIPHPHDFFHVIPGEAMSALLRVLSRPGGGARAELDLTCADVGSAGKVAAALREQAERANGIVVRMLTHDLLGGLSIEVDGTTAKLALPASREQLEALATLAAGLIPEGAPR